MKRFSTLFQITATVIWPFTDVPQFQINNTNTLGKKISNFNNNHKATWNFTNRTNQTQLSSLQKKKKKKKKKKSKNIKKYK